MNRTLIPAALLGAVLLFASLWTHAMEAGVTRDGRSFVSGGIGEEEARVLQAARADFSLGLTTAAYRSGAYLADALFRRLTGIKAPHV